MIKVETFQMGKLASNSHLLYDTESKKCLIIDLGGHFSEIEKEISARGLILKALLLTHGHFDHSFGAKSSSDNNVEVYIGKKDAYMLGSAKDSLAETFGCPFEPCERFKTLSEGTFDIGGFTVDVIETPGHSKGSLCYIIEDRLFCGDTLFFESFGRYDLPGGNVVELIRSAKKIFSLKNYTVYTGHGENTTVEHEKIYNPLAKYVH